MAIENPETVASAFKGNFVYRPMTSIVRETGSSGCQEIVDERRMRMERTALATFQSIFLAPDQLDFYQPANGFVGRYIDAANLSAYFNKSINIVDCELFDGSEAED